MRDKQSDERDLVAEFDAAYATTPPWDIGRPQSAFASLAAEGRLAGRVLDVGCGTGEHVLMAAGTGGDAVGIDISPIAIRLATEKARKRRIPARFVVGDARRLDALSERFDVVLDCGLFHVFDDEDRLPFVESLARVVRPRGRYFMLCFSEEEPAGWGPRRVTQAEIHKASARDWHVETIEPTSPPRPAAGSSIGSASRASDIPFTQCPGRPPHDADVEGSSMLPPAPSLPATAADGRAARPAGDGTWGLTCSRHRGAVRPVTGHAIDGVRLRLSFDVVVT